MRATLTLILFCNFIWQLHAQVSFVLSSTVPVGPEAQFVIPVDVNGDGQMDLVTANQDNDTLTVLTNNGSGAFALASNAPGGHDPVALVSADVNGDGKMDLIAASYFTGLYVSTNDGSGNFHLSSSAMQGSASLSDTVVDLYGDGNLALVCANSSPSSISVFTNNGTSGFVTSAVYTVGNNPWCVIAADVNGDGKSDLITANYADNTLSVLTNNGNGGFVAASTNAVGGGPRSVAAADINGDGKPDLISANSADSTVSVLTNNGSGGFLVSGIYHVGSSPVFVTAADINGDGAMDLITANNSDMTLTVLTNNGAGIFSVAATIPSGHNPRAVAVADINHDGRLDLISVNQEDSNVAVITNATPFPPPSMPMISAQPSSKTNLIGTTASFAVGAKAAIGLQIFNYQWRFNGTNLLTETNGTLNLSNVALGQAGSYDVVVSDSAGSVTSNPAMLDVLGTLVEINGRTAAPTNTAALSATVSLFSFPGGFIFYTLDGSTPSPDSALYEDPIVLSNTAVVRTMSFSADFTEEYFSAPVLVQIVAPLNATTPGGGSITVNGMPTSSASNYLTGTDISLAAVPMNGWSFLGWQGSVSGTNNPISLTVDQTSSVRATFGTTVMTNVYGSGQLVLNQPNPVPYGTVVTASAVADPGSCFLRWGGSASGTNSPTTVTVTTANPSVSALFGTLPASKYSLSVVVVGDGSVGNNSQRNYYNPGDTVVLTATPSSSAYFLGWTLDTTGTTNPLTIQMTGNKVIQANFGHLPNVGINPNAITIFAGSNATLTATTAGLPSLSYQWLKDGAAMPDATNAIFPFYNTQPSDAGIYSVVVSNSFGSITSSVATVSVTGMPMITDQPTPATVVIGHTSSFVVGAQGWPSLSYQWQFDGMNLNGATNSALMIANTFPANEGTYMVVITNVYGSVTSNPVGLTVLPLNIDGPKLVGGRFQLTFDTATGANYEVDYSTNLLDWYPWLNLSGTGQPSTISDPNSVDSPQRFYRLVLSPQ